MTVGRIGALLLAVLWAAPARATCDSTDACLRALEVAQADTRTISARFVQTKYLSLLDEPLVSSGRFLFKRPDRMRLEIESPRPATILISGRDISIPGLQPQERQALASSPMAAMFTELGALFSGSPTALRAHFDVEAVAAADGIDITLVPTLPAWQRLFRRIGLRFVAPQFTVSRMRLDDSLGDRLEIDMRDVQRNVDLPDHLFTDPPATPSGSE